MLGTDKKTVDVYAPYREETIKVPVVITAVVLMLVSAPWIMRIIKINDEGKASTNISQYDELVERVSFDTRTVDAMIRNDAEELASINSGKQKSSVTLIVPEVVIVDKKKPVGAASPLKVRLEGIYWSASNPLVGIEGETYRVGDRVHGYEIVRIGKTSVQFQAQDGTIVVKDMYENLLQR